MNIDLDTYIISDTHFGHKNIIQYCGRPEDHDELMIKNWWRTISIDDTILHLGDLTFKKDYVPWKNLPGDKYLIKGNHDHQKDSWYKENGFTILPKRVFFIMNRQRIMFTHYPEPYEGFEHWDINIHGHIHNNSYEVKRWGEKLYINVSIEVMDYKPVKLGEILSTRFSLY